MISVRFPYALTSQAARSELDFYALDAFEGFSETDIYHVLDQTQAADVAGHVGHMNHRRHHWSRETCLRQRVKWGARVLNLERQQGIIHSFKVAENRDPNILAVFVLPAVLYE